VRAMTTFLEEHVIPLERRKYVTWVLTWFLLHVSDNNSEKIREWFPILKGLVCKLVKSS
jgi:hypothetical protein